MVDYDLTDEQKDAIASHLRKEEPIRDVYADPERVVLVANRYIATTEIGDGDWDETQIALLTDKHVSGVSVQNKYIGTLRTFALIASGVITFLLGIVTPLYLYGQGFNQEIFAPPILLSIIGVLLLIGTVATYEKKKVLTVHTNQGVNDFEIEFSPDVDESVFNAVFESVETIEDKKE